MAASKEEIRELVETYSMGKEDLSKLFEIKLPTEISPVKVSFVDPSVELRQRVENL